MINTFEQSRVHVLSTVTTRVADKTSVLAFLAKERKKSGVLAPHQDKSDKKSNVAKGAKGLIQYSTSLTSLSFLYV